MAMSRPDSESLAMRPIQVKQLDYDFTPTAGLALVGHYLKAMDDPVTP